MQNRSRLYSVAPRVGAVLALVALGAAVTLKRYAARRRLAGAAAASTLAPRLARDRMRALETEAFFDLCTAYYESRHFHLHNVRRRDRAIDADAYFGTLPRAVAIVRVLASGDAPAGLDAIEDLRETMSRRGVVKGIVHNTGGYTEAAAAFARAHRIRLVPLEDLSDTIATLPLAARLALCGALPARESRRSQHDALQH